MTSSSDSPFEARVRELFLHRLEGRRGDLVLTDALIEETVRGAEIRERPDGIWLRIANVSYGPSESSGLDLMAAVQAELDAAALDAQRERGAAPRS